MQTVACRLRRLASEQPDRLLKFSEVLRLGTAWKAGEAHRFDQPVPLYLGEGEVGDYSLYAQVRILLEGERDKRPSYDMLATVNASRALSDQTATGLAPKS